MKYFELICIYFLSGLIEISYLGLINCQKMHKVIKPHNEQKEIMRNKIQHHRHPAEQHQQHSTKKKLVHLQKENYRKEQNSQSHINELYLRRTPVKLVMERFRHASNYLDIFKAFQRSNDDSTNKELNDVMHSTLDDYNYQQDAVAVVADDDDDDDDDDDGYGYHFNDEFNVSTDLGNSDINVSESDQWESALNHYWEMSKRCQQPVAKMIKISDLFSYSDRQYIPDCTIVHRCHRDACCCNSTSEYRVKDSAIVSIDVWEIQFVQGSRDWFEPPPNVKKITFINHTSCECVTKTSQCVDCPWPFVLENEYDPSCTCGCASRDNSMCLGIANGEYPLQRKIISCIKNNECHPPGCYFGRFNTETGFCPCIPENKDCLLKQTLHLLEELGSGEIDLGELNLEEIIPQTGETDVGELNLEETIPQTGETDLGELNLEETIPQTVDSNPQGSGNSNKEAVYSNNYKKIRHDPVTQNNDIENDEVNFVRAELLHDNDRAIESLDNDDVIKAAHLGVNLDKEQNHEHHARNKQST